MGVLLFWGLHGQLPEPGEPAPQLADPLVRLQDHLLDPDRTARPHDAAQVRRELLHLVEGTLF